MRKTLTLVSAVVAAAAVTPAASAHVTLDPPEAVAGSFARFAVRVPNERPNAATTKVTVSLPEGLFFVSFQPKPGWKRSLAMAAVDPPVEILGETISERVATVTWTGGRIGPGEFEEFALSARIPDAPGRELLFPSVQTYSNREVVRWIGSADSDEPAPHVTVTAAAKQVAGRTTADRETTGSASGGGGSSQTRANVALGFGAGGLAAGLAALGLTFAGRRRRT